MPVKIGDAPALACVCLNPHQQLHSLLIGEVMRELRTHNEVGLLECL
jgi:hypothetical protein